MSDESGAPADKPDADKGGQSGNYTPPATQADLDRIISERVSRERGKYADYDDLKAKAEQFDAVEAANKTEAQKQAEALAAAQAELKKLQARDQVAGWKAEVVSELTDLDAAQKAAVMSALAGNTKEEIEAHAKTLLSLIPAKPGGPIVPNAGDTPAIPLNSSALEASLRRAVGAK